MPFCTLTLCQRDYRATTASARAQVPLWASERTVLPGRPQDPAAGTKASLILLLNTRIRTRTHHCLLIFHLLPHFSPLSLPFPHAGHHLRVAVRRCRCGGRSDGNKSYMCFRTRLGCKCLVQMCVLSKPSQSGGEFPMLAEGVVPSGMYDAPG